jgi:PIN domain nuclease of toxin-antitoxin system
VRFLLDTHVWLWMLAEPDRLGASVEWLTDGRSDLLLSAASTWELTIKSGLGRLELPEPVAEYVPDRVRATRVTPLAIEHRHTLEVAALPPLHRDPFDRLLVAQARVEDVPLVTADRRLADYDVVTRLIPER